MSEKQKDPLVILVDMDGVLTDFVGGWITGWNILHPDNLIPTDRICDDFYVENAFRDIVKTEEAANEVFHKEGFFFGLEPIPGAIEGIKQMAGCNNVIVTLCTAPTTSKHCWQEKADWVELYLGKEWLRHLIITKDKTMIHGDYLIDDKPDITGIYAPSWQQVIYDQPYNQHVLKLLRVNWTCWPDIFLHHADREDR